MIADPVVLVVDDDPGVRQVLVTALEMDGMTVVDAAHGQEALRILQHDPTICVLVADIMMPGITGVTLVEQAAKLRPDVKTLLMTAYAPDDLVHGAGSVVKKPIPVAELCANIRALCAAGAPGTSDR
jgi:CheY-like chemotaxis protein